MYEIEGFDQLIIIDAFHTTDTIPGRVRTLSLEDLSGGDATTTSGHLLSLPKAIELSGTLGYKTPKLLAAVVIDVGHDGLEFGEHLTPDVANAVPLAADIVCRLVRETLSRTSATRGGQDARGITL